MESLSPTVLSTACGLMATLLSASLAIYVFKKEAFEKLIEEKPDDATMMERARKFFRHNYLLFVVATCVLAIIYDFVPLLFRCAFFETKSAMIIMVALNLFALGCTTLFMYVSLEPGYEKTLAKNISKTLNAKDYAS